MAKYSPTWQEPGGDEYPTTLGPLVADGGVKGVKVLCPACVAALPAAWYAGAPLADPVEHDVCDVCMRRVLPVADGPMQLGLDGSEVPHEVDVPAAPMTKPEQLGWALDGGAPGQLALE